MNFILLSLLLIVMIVFSKNGILENDTVKYAIYGYSGIQIREYLGFDSPNTSGLIFWSIRSSFYYLNYYRIKFYHFVVFGILVIILYLQTYSRTTLYIFIFEVLLFYILKYKYRILKKIIIIVPTINMVFFFLLSIYSYETVLNKILSNRLKYSYEFIKSINLQSFLLGIKESFYLPLDNSWIGLLHDYGILVSIIMLILMTVGLKNMLKLEKEIESKKIIFLFLTCLIYSTSEAVLFSPYYSFIMIILIKYNFLQGENDVESRDIKKSTTNNVR